MPGKEKKFTAKELAQLARKRGALKAKVIRAATVVTGQWVRWKCRFGCSGYDTSRLCPPHLPPVAEFERVLSEYKRAVLFEAPRGRSRAIAAAAERELFLAGCYRAFGLGSGPCRLCDECAFDEGCRHPDEARPAMEACGIDVYATARGNGFAIEVVTSSRQKGNYFGLVLVD